MAEVRGRNSEFGIRNSEVGSGKWEFWILDRGFWIDNGVAVLNHFY